MFEILLQIGNELERNGQYVTACAVYMEAKTLCDKDSQQIINGFLPTLIGKFPAPQGRNEEVRERMLQWISDEELDLAMLCYRNIFENLNGMDWIDCDNVILYHRLRVLQTALYRGEHINDAKNTDMNRIRKWYYDIKFMIRRIDMKVCDENAFLAFLKGNQIGKSELLYMIEHSCFEPERVCVYLEKLFEENHMTDYAEWVKTDEAQEPIAGPTDIESYEPEKEEKIAFIIAVNDETMYQEAQYYISKLDVPKNMTVEVFPIRGAKSMTEAYNRGMQESDARYKVYLHQDVIIINPHFIHEVCKIFSDSEIGMIGIAGVEKMPDTGVWWENDGEGDYRNLYQDLVAGKGHTEHNLFEECYRPVEVIDGALMITQYDVTWREDVFQGWHFYDMSQCMEFKKNKYQVVVAGQQSGVWCLHEQKWNKELDEAFQRDKEKFLSIYP